MRVVLKEYANGGRGAFQTSDDGGVTIAEWAGPRKVGEQVCAFVEVACDNTDEGVDRLINALAWLADELKKRKSELTKEPKKRKGKSLSA